MNCNFRNLKSPSRTNVLISFSLVLISACSTSPVKRLDASKRVAIHGHRGTRGTAPENTIPAFKEALTIPVDALELDTVMSKDGVVIVSHDPFIDGTLCKDSKGRNLKKPLAIKTLTAKSIQQYDCGSIANEKFPEQKLVPKTPKPTLSQVIELVVQKSPLMDMNIETKMSAEETALNPDPKEFASKIVSLLRKYHRVEKTILQSFDFRTLNEAHALEPGLRISALVDKNPNFCELALQIGASIASPEFSLVTEDRVRKCHELKIQVAPWTVNQEEDWAKLIAMGVDAIITDYPKKLRTYVAEKVKP